MRNSITVLLILLTVAGALLATWLVRRRIQIGEDFASGRRRLPATLCGISQAVNSIPLWFLLALSAYAFTVGLAALWLAVASFAGLAINGWFVAPRLREQAVGTHTVSQWFSASAGERMVAATSRSAAIIVVCAVGLTTVTLAQWTADFLSAAAGISFATALVLQSLVVFFVVFFGGIWSASASDLIQAGLLLFVLCCTAIGGIVAVGGFAPLKLGLSGDLSNWFGGYEGVLALSLFVGLSFAAFGSAAQPAAISRYLACKDDLALQSARRQGMAWGALVLIAALIVGWCAKVLAMEATAGRFVLSGLIAHSLPQWVASIVSGGFIATLGLACLSPCLALATHLATDLDSSSRTVSLVWCRVALVVLLIAIPAGALYLPPGNEDRLWFCWHALGAAFAPLLLVRLTGKKVRAGSALGAMWSGFILTLLFHVMPDTPGDLMERSLPFIAAMGIALSGGERRRNPDRADRGDRTVHDHLPI
jgi:sodium/proline symporter